MKTEQTICIYCGRRPKETDDHVPPKSFYPQPRPSDLITVPSCLRCNQDPGKDEEFFLATFMFSYAGATDAGKSLWAGKLKRMYEKNLGLKKKIAEHLQHAEIVTPAGLFLGRRMAIETDELRFEKVVNKIVRGLYYFEYQKPLPAQTKVMTIFLSEQKRFETVKNFVHQLKPGSRNWKGIFEYKFNRVAKSLSESMWLLVFWDFATFWTISFNEDHYRKRHLRR